MPEAVKVPRLGKARFGEPALCPFCNGTLQPMFGQRIEGDVRVPVLDATRAQCGTCRRVFVTED